MFRGAAHGEQEPNLPTKVAREPTEELVTGIGTFAAILFARWTTLAVVEVRFNASVFLARAHAGAVARIIERTRRGPLAQPIRCAREVGRITEGASLGSRWQYNVDSPQCQVTLFASIDPPARRVCPEVVRLVLVGGGASRDVRPEGLTRAYNGTGGPGHPGGALGPPGPICQFLRASRGALRPTRGHAVEARTTCDARSRRTPYLLFETDSQTAVSCRLHDHTQCRQGRWTPVEHRPSRQMPSAFGPTTIARRSTMARSARTSPIQRIPITLALVTSILRRGMEPQRPTASYLRGDANGC